MRHGTEGFIPARLVEARAARFISTQIALAGLLNVHTSAVSRWEDGKAAPEPEKLLELAHVLRLRPSYFLRPKYEHGSNPVFFRSLASARAREISRQRARLCWLQEISQVVQHYVSFPAVSLSTFNIGNFRQLRSEDIEALALKLRDVFRLGDDPIANVIPHIEAAGVIVGNDEMGSTRFDGMCQWSDCDRRPYILLASDKMSFFRRQMDASHELAHVVLHRNVTEAELKNKDDFDLIEEQAFRLAGAFLMPATSFANSVGASPTLASLLALKDVWKVSVKAMITRCQQLDIIDKLDAQQLYKQYSAKGWNSGEPFDGSVALAMPRLLAQSIEMIVTAGRSKEQLLANEFTIPADDIEKLVALPEGWFEQRSAEVVKLKPLALQSRFEADRGGYGEIVQFDRKRT